MSFHQKELLNSPEYKNKVRYKAKHARKTFF